MATLIDSYSETNKSNISFVYTANYLGQSFTGTGLAIGSAQWYMRKSGSPSGNLVAKIYAHSGTYGTNSLPTGVALATSDVVNSTTLPTSFTLVTFTFSGANQI